MFLKIVGGFALERQRLVKLVVQSVEFFVGRTEFFRSRAWPVRYCTMHRRELWMALAHRPRSEKPVKSLFGPRFASPSFE